MSWLPDDVKDFIRSNFMQKRDVLRLTKLPGYNREILPLIFKSGSPLIPSRIDLDQVGADDIGKEIVGRKSFSEETKDGRAGARKWLD